MNSSFSARGANGPAIVIMFLLFLAAAGSFILSRQNGAPGLFALAQALRP